MYPFEVFAHVQRADNVLFEAKSDLSYASLVDILIPS